MGKIVREKRLMAVLVCLVALISALTLASCAGGGASSASQPASQVESSAEQQSTSQDTSSATEQSSSQEASSSAAASSVAVAPSSESSASSSQTSASSSEAAASSSKESSAKGINVEVKASVNDYTWAELSQISTEISAAGGEAGGIEIAKVYNLCNPDGMLDGSQAKDVTLADGTDAQVMILGFAHDDKTGGGKAGITFQFVDCIAEHEMNSELTNAGGWEASAMRAWLNSDVRSWLPEDLSTVIVSVDKQTNNVGKTKSISSVTTTSDLLWLPSVHELSGDVDWFSTQSKNDIINAEGNEYKLFRDMNVENGNSNYLTYTNDILAKNYDGTPSTWWQRSPRGTNQFYEVIEVIGHPTSGINADYSQGVAPGFCI